jgi:ABC-type nitrate/sulfonate/bicarbonate transport system substrate-binding protein
MTDDGEARSRPDIVGGPGSLGRREFLRWSGRLGLGAAVLPAAGLVAWGGGAKKVAPAVTAAATSRPVSLQLSYLASVEYAGYYLAQQLGYYSADHVAATLIGGGPTVAIEAEVAAGKALVGIDGADIIMSARQQGAPLVMFGAQFQKNPLGNVSLASKAVDTPKELVGKTVGVPSSLETTMNQFLAINGIRPSSVHFVPYQGDPGPLVNGSIDAGMTFVTETVPFMEAQHLKSHSFLFDDYGYHVYNDCPFTTETVLRERHDDLVDWLRATIKGWQYQNTHVSAGVDLVVSKYGKSQGLTVANQKLQAEEQLPLMVTPTTKSHGLFWMADSDIEANVSTISRLGIKATKAAFDTTVLTAALGGKASVT